MKLYCIATALTALMLQGVMCELAYIERGYAAVGGEVFVTPVVIYISYKIFANREEIKSHVFGILERVKGFGRARNKSKLV